MPQTKRSGLLANLIGILFTGVSQFVVAYSTILVGMIYPAWSCPFWPASGVALAACILRGPWMLLGVYTGLVLTHYFRSPSPSWIGYVLPMGNILETGLAWWLLNVFIQRFDSRLARVSDVGFFCLLAPWIPSLLSALFAQTILYSNNIIPVDRFASEVLVYWLGNATGIIILTPLILVWRDVLKYQWSLQKGRQIIFMLSVGLLGLFLYHNHLLPNYIRTSYVLLIPILAWGVWSTGFRGATLLSTLFACGYFIMDSPTLRSHSIILKERNLAANIAFATWHRFEPPFNKFLPPPSMVAGLLEQVGILASISLTVLPLGAASDELRQKAKQDDLVMQALGASFWSWTAKDGLRIQNPMVARMIGPHPLLFKANEGTGSINVPSMTESQIDFNSYWAVTEKGTEGNPLVVTGILQGHAKSMSHLESNKKSEIDNLKVQALRAHLNPHLIFNCLTGLRSMIKTNPELARDFTSRLARFLRAVVDSQSSTLISLTHEIDICLDYVALETMRGKEIDFLYEAEQQGVCIFLPPLSLVTLVENAVKHGQRDDSGKLSIDLLVRKDRLGRGIITLRHGGFVREKQKGRSPGGLSLLKQQLKTIHHPDSTVELLQISPNLVEARMELISLQSS
jgi:integral membrane sensor domain MASE1